MLLTVFLAIIFCGAITLLLIAAVAFIQDKKFFSSAPKEALEVFVPRNRELFYGARAMGWVLLILGVLMILGVGVISVWDGFRSGFFSLTGFFSAGFTSSSITTLRWRVCTTAESMDTTSKVSC